MTCSKHDGDAGQQQGRSTPYPNVPSLNLNDVMNDKLAHCVNHLKDEIKTVETGLADTSNHLASAERSLPKKAKSSSFQELGNSRKYLYRHAEGYGSFHFSKSRRHRRIRFSPLREVPEGGNMFIRNVEGRQRFSKRFLIELRVSSRPRYPSDIRHKTEISAAQQLDKFSRLRLEWPTVTNGSFTLCG